MKTQKSISLLNDLTNKEYEFATKKWDVIANQAAKEKCGQKNSIKFETESIKSSLCDYSHAFILATGDISQYLQTMIQMLYLKFVRHFLHARKINDVFIDERNDIYIAMPFYNLIEYTDNNSDTSENLWHKVPFKNADLSADNSPSFKYKVATAVDAVNNMNTFVKSTKIVVPLNYLSNLWRSLEMLLINCKVNPELNWIEDCILLSAADFEQFKITVAKLHVPIVTFSTKDNVNVTKQLSNGFLKDQYIGTDQNILTIPGKVINQGTNIYIST